MRAAQDKQFIWRPFTQMKNLGTVPLVESAKGEKLFLKDGSSLIDAISSWWVITHGHCEEHIIKAIQDQAQKLDQALFANFTHSPAEIFTEKLYSFLPPSLSRFFFSDNGSTAVEVALKMAFQACLEKGESKRKSFLSFEHAYHGDTVGAMSVGGESYFTAAYRELLFDVIRVKQGRYSYESAEAYTKDFFHVFERRHKELTAVILEPLVQGAGGMILWPKESVRSIVEACQKEGVYVIFDEVMTGFGRTGELFALDAIGVEPDFLCLSKGITGGVLPMALTVTKNPIYEAFLSHKKEKMFFHGHSFTGNPITCAAAIANLELLEKGDWKENTRRIGDIHQNRLENLSIRKHLKDWRSCGTIAVLELDSKKAYASSLSEALQKSALEKGVFLRPLGNVIYLLPPYCISSSELNRTWDVVESSLQELLA